MNLRKERIEWLLSLIINQDMQEIDNQFYELLPEEKQFICHAFFCPLLP